MHGGRGPGGPGGPGGMGGPGGPGGGFGGGFPPPPPTHHHHYGGWGRYPYGGSGCLGCLFPFLLGLGGFIALIVLLIGAIF